MSCNCGIGITFGGWAEPACTIHDHEYELMKAGQQTKTLDQVDMELLSNLLELANKGRFQFGKRLMAYTMYRIAHAYGLVFWHGPR